MLDTLENGLNSESSSPQAGASLKKTARPLSVFQCPVNIARGDISA
jgi:hypothetical protein